MADPGPTTPQPDIVKMWEYVFDSMSWLSPETKVSWLMDEIGLHITFTDTIEGVRQSFRFVTSKEQFESMVDWRTILDRLIDHYLETRNDGKPSAD